jgi:hypothetical protein
MDECFICYTPDGKTPDEKINEIFLGRRSYPYPLVKLSQAFGCDCSGSLAHNKCLIGIKKCPTCRKHVTKPNLYVRTSYDNIFGWLFNCIKSNPHLIKIIKNFASIFVVSCFGLHLIIDNKIIVISSNLTVNFTIGLLLVVQFVGGFCLIFEDYFVKYWLYDAKNNKFLS